MVFHITDVPCDHSAVIENNHRLKSYLTQNMQDRQTQVRAGPARAVGKLRETDGMVTDCSDAAATDQ